MQLVHLSKFLACAWAMLLFLVTLKNFDVCMGSCMPSSPKEYIHVRHWC